MSKADLARDRQVTWAIHKLFWQAAYHRPQYFWLTWILHPPFFFLVNVYVPLQISYGIQAIITRHFDQVGGHAWTIILVMLVAQLIFLAGTWAFNRDGTYGAAFVQRQVFANYLNKDYDFYSNQFIGSLGVQAARLRDAFEDYNRVFMFEIPRSSVIAITGLVVIGVKSPGLAALTALFVVITVTGTVIVARFRLKYRRALSRASNELAGVLGDGLSHGATVKSFAQEEYEQQKMLPPLQKWIVAQLRTWDSSMPHTFIRHMLLAVTMAVLLLASARLYQQGVISIALVALVQLYVARVVTISLDVGEIIKKYEALMSAAYEPVATMMIPGHVNDPAVAKSLAKQTSYRIDFKNVTYHYPEAAEGQAAVDDFSLTVNEGERIGLVGYSGGGKTTVTKLLLRFMDVSQGSIRINGIDIRNLKQAELRRIISYVPQEPLLFHRSIKENIAYAQPKANDESFNQVAKVAYVDNFVKDLPAGFDTLVGERGVKLSGGQRQRVAVARALLKNAPILVLDEATSALDSQSEKYIQKALWQLMKGRTAIVIAHRLSTIQHMDRIVVVDKGKIVQVGSHQELLKIKDGIYAQLWSHQSGGYLAEA